MGRSLKMTFTLTLLTWMVVAHHSQAGERLFSAKRAAIWFGSRELNIQNNETPSNLDFLNYANTYDHGEYFILGLSLQLQGREPWSLSLDAFTSDGIIPTSFIIDFQYNLLPWLALNGGLLKYPFLITGYERYYKETDLDFYTDGGQYANVRQSTVHDFVLTLGPSLHFEGGAGFISLHFNMAYGSLLPFVQTFQQKKINANMRQEAIYKTTPSSSFFLFPRLIIGKNILHFDDSHLGIQAQASVYAGYRHIHYNHTLRKWTEAQTESRDVISPDHLFRQTDINFGLYWRF